MTALPDPVGDTASIRVTPRERASPTFVMNSS
jgi:hypothetical protein